MRCATRDSGEGVVVVSLSGELDMASGALARQEFQRAALDARRAVVVDIARLSFMDSSGAGVLLDAAEQIRRSGLGFAVLSGTTHPHRVIDLLCLNEYLSVVDDLTSVLDSSDNGIQQGGGARDGG